jgi:hypothetical protein
MMDWRRERRELMEYLLEHDWDVFGTLKFVDGRTIGSVTAHKLLRSYWNRIDRVFFGHAADRKGVRVPRWCFAHEGADTENFHIHFLLKSPLVDIEHACCVLNAVWAQHHQQTGPLAKNWIMPVIRRRDAVNYVTREYWRMGSATLLDEISWAQTSAADMAAQETEQQAHRINKAASSAWITAATAALSDQQSRYTHSS